MPKITYIEHDGKAQTVEVRAGLVGDGRRGQEPRARHRRRLRRRLRLRHLPCLCRSGLGAACRPRPTWKKPCWISRQEPQPNSRLSCQLRVTSEMDGIWIACRAAARHPASEGSVSSRYAMSRPSSVALLGCGVSRMRRGTWQRTRVPPLCAFDLHPAVMQFQEAVDQRQAQPRARALCRAWLWAEKRSNTLAFTSGARPGPLSAHRDLHILAHDAARQRDRRRRAA